MVEGSGAYTLKIRSGCDGGEKGPLVQTEKSATLSTLQDQTLFCLQGNLVDRTKNSDPNGSGCRDDGKSFTLNTRDRHVVCLQGNMIDRDVQQHGSGIAESETMFTLNATDRHGVCWHRMGRGAGTDPASGWRVKRYAYGAVQGTRPDQCRSAE